MKHPYTSTEQITTLLEFVSDIGLKAGALLRDAYHQPREIDYKGAVDLVTQADRAAEDLIISAIREQFPDHDILAEESGASGTSGELTWIIDPLDGTTNFAHGFPVFCVSIALQDRQGPLVGVVYDPLRDELFAAGRGIGASLNGNRMQVSATTELNRALVATGFPYDRQTAEDNNIEAASRFIREIQGLRRAGAAALDLCYVACGRIDAYWEMKVKPWDIAAGVLLVQEAGGTVTNYDGDADITRLFSELRILTTNGKLHDQMLGILKEVYSS